MTASGTGYKPDLVGGSCYMMPHFPADPIDARVVAAFFAAASPEELDAWARAQDTRRQVEDALDRAEAQQVERQFNRVDPDNRLVASELEHRWEATLRELRRAEEALVLHRASRTQPDALTPEERDGFLALGPQLPAMWRQPGMDRAHKKALLRCLIEKVVLHRTAPERIGIRIVWRGGEVSEEQVEPRVLPCTPCPAAPTCRHASSSWPARAWPTQRPPRS